MPGVDAHESITRVRRHLRGEMRRRRRALSNAERNRAAQAVAERIAHGVRLAHGARVGAYLSAGSELDTRPLLDLAQRSGWQIFVPVVVDARTARMRFAPLRGALRLNRFGIAEPAIVAAPGDAGWIAPRWLDVVFLPLLAVGPRGERLGSGAGFYDRAFAYRRLRSTWGKPPLIGLAHDFQRVAALPRAPWDVPLDRLITDRDIYRFRSAPA